MKKIIVRYGQTIFDIAIQEYGCYEGVTVLCQDNVLSLSSELVAGQVLLIQITVPDFSNGNMQVVNYLVANGIKPNSGYQKPIITAPFYSGGFYGSFFEI